MNDDNPYKAPESITSTEVNQADNQPPYPTTKYTVYGSMMGGFLLGLFGLITNIIHGDIEIISGLFSLILSPIFSLFAGFIPAALTGKVLEWRKFQISMPSDYLKIGLIGFLFSGLYVIAILGFESHWFAYSGDGYMPRTLIPILSVVGAISAMITANLVLPNG